MKKLLITAAYITEVSALIKYFELTQRLKKPYMIFSNEDIDLVITKSGKIHSAIATTWAFDHHAKIFNLGICGAKKTIEIGSVCPIRWIVDFATGKKFVLEKSGFTLTTVDKAITEETYIKSDLCDMEASGFYQAATVLVDKSNIKIYKIVSDHLSDTVNTTLFQKIIADQFIQIIQRELE